LNPGAKQSLFANLPPGEFFDANARCHRGKRIAGDYINIDQSALTGESLNHVHARPAFVPNAVARDSRWIRRRHCETGRDIRRFSAANLERQIRCSERSWNCVDGQAVGLIVTLSLRREDTA